jgi:hypothetical protein
MKKIVYFILDTKISEESVFNILCHSDSSPPLTACTILVIVIDSSFVEQVEEYTCLNTDSSEILDMKSYG